MFFFSLSLCVRIALSSSRASFLLPRIPRRDRPISTETPRVIGCAACAWRPSLARDPSCLVVAGNGGKGGEREKKNEGRGRKNKGEEGREREKERE